ncbi:diacylglycerol/lipid kinase family protein [Thermodesulfobacteriota bacterium]
MPGNPGKITFIVNPNAGMQSVAREWPRIERRAKDRLGAFQACITGAQGDATRMATRAIMEGAELIVCIGGDGTLNEVVNGFMGEDGPLRDEVKLAFIPRGTGGDFIKTVHLPQEMDEAFDLIKSRPVRLIDLGRIQYMDHRGQTAVRYFHNVASFGLGGEVDERVNRTTKVFGGFISFIWATLISLLIYKKKLIRLKVDDLSIPDFVNWNVAVANGQYHGGGMWVAPEAAVDDGLFQITVIGDFSLPEVFWSLPQLYNGKLLQLEKVISYVGKKVEACSDQKVLLDIDGEQPGCLPATIEIVPKCLNLITPNHP